MGAFRDRKAADDHKQRGNDGRGIHPAPGANLWNVLEHQIADDRPGQRANGLEGEGASTSLPRMPLGMLSEMTKWAVG